MPLPPRVSVILGGIIGVFIGITLFALISANRINELEQINYEIKKELVDTKFKVEQRDLLIKDYQDEHEILITTALEDKHRMEDLENNIELLRNNIPEIKELVVDNQTNN